MLLDGGIPKGLNFAPGYPSRFSLEVMEAVISQEPGRFGPYFSRRAGNPPSGRRDMVGHTTSRRVMEKAGMRQCGARVDIEDGEPVDLVSYEALATTPPEAD